MRDYHYILDANKQPVVCTDVLVWTRWFADINNRRVARTQITDDIVVSTVFLGIDHGFGETSEPLLFETMAFFSGGGQDCERTWSWARAMVQHNDMVARVRVSLEVYDKFAIHVSDKERAQS